MTAGPRGCLAQPVSVTSWRQFQYLKADFWQPRPRCRASPPGCSATKCLLTVFFGAGRGGPVPQSSGPSADESPVHLPRGRVFPRRSPTSTTCRGLSRPEWRSGQAWGSGHSQVWSSEQWFRKQGCRALPAPGPRDRRWRRSPRSPLGTNLQQGTQALQPHPHNTALSNDAAPIGKLPNPEPPAYSSSKVTPPTAWP